MTKKDITSGSEISFVSGGGEPLSGEAETPRIFLLVERSDGRRSVTSVDGSDVLPSMLEAVEDLLHTLTTGERALPKDFHAACALAFDTTPEDAKERLFAAMRGGKKSDGPGPWLIGFTWRAHLAELLADVRAEKWLSAARMLGKMLAYTLDKVQEKASLSETKPKK